MTLFRFLDYLVIEVVLLFVPSILVVSLSFLRVSVKGTGRSTRVYGNSAEL